MPPQEGFLGEATLGRALGRWASRLRYVRLPPRPQFSPSTYACEPHCPILQTGKFRPKFKFFVPCSRSKR